jgi:hypothetical protein
MSVTGTACRGLNSSAAEGTTLSSAYSRYLAPLRRGPFFAFPAKSTGYVWGAEAQASKSFIFPKSRPAPAASENVPERSSS